MQRKISFGLGSILLLFCSACQPVTDQQKVQVTSDTMHIWTDSSLRALVNEEIKSFQGLEKPPHIQLHVANEADIVQSILKDQIDVAVLQRALNQSEVKYIQSKEDFKVKHHAFAKQAFVVLASNNFTSSYISVDDLRASMQNNQPYHVLLEDAKSASVQFVLNYFQWQKMPQYVFAEKGFNAMCQYLTQHKDAVGLIPYSYISDVYTSDSQTVFKGLKVLSIATSDSTAIAASQSSIATGDYPLVNSVVFINANMKQKSGINFVNYLFKPSAQRLILKFGLVPVIFPGREILIK